jgi:peroxiredoxin Q/BCP
LIDFRLIIRILGVSADVQKRQAKFKDKYEFPFHYSLMKIKSVIKEIGLGTKNLWEKNTTIHRTTFVIDEKEYEEDVDL